MRESITRLVVRERSGWLSGVALRSAALVAIAFCTACGTEPTGTVGAPQTETSTAAPAAEAARAPAALPRCELLDDPGTRAAMGFGLERKLLAVCGRLPAPARQDLGAGPTALPPQRGNGGGFRVPGERQALGDLALFAELSGTDILVNDPALDTGGSTQSETSVVAVGNVVCAAWNDAGEGFFANGGSGFGFSLDGGQTFSDGGPFPQGPGDNNFGDPSLAYSRRDDTFYYAALSSLGLSIWRSLDSCQSFEYVGPIHQGGGDDKELMAVDNTPSSPFYGRIYVGWTDFNASDERNVAAFSDDGGQTWSAPSTFPGSGFAGQGVYPAVAPNGDVYMALVDRAFEVGGLQDQWIYRSTDGGVTYVQMTNIGSDQLQPENQPNTASCGRQALTGDIRNLSSPQIVISPSSSAPAGYRIHAIYPYDSDGTGPDNSNVFYRHSDDGASTWSPEVLLNDDATTTDQFFPSLGLSDTGVLVASWYDRRLDPTSNLGFDRFAAFSTDFGDSFSENERISDVTSPVAQTNPNFDNLATCYHGDYDQVSVIGNVAHIVWSDDRRITGAGPNPDVYYDQLSVNPSAGRLLADRGTVSCSGTIAFTLSDIDIAGTGSQAISLTTTTGDSETLLLIEDPARPGVFLGSVGTAPLPVSIGNGSLEIADGATITGTYADADDGSGNPATSSDEVVADCVGPVISNVRTETVLATSAIVAADVTEPAVLTVEFGLSCASLTRIATSANLSPPPSATLADLAPGRTYYYAVTAADAVGNTASDDNGGNCYTFRTLSLVYEEDFEGGLGGFGVDGLWHVSTACASSAFGHSLPTTLYYGQDATCHYDTGIANQGVATSPVIHLSDASDASLEFNYFLGTEGGGFFDQASVEVSVDGGPFEVIESNFTDLFFVRQPPGTRTRPNAPSAGRYALIENSESWQHAVVDLGPTLEGLTDADIQLRFHFNTVDSVLNRFAGFYVDDVQVFGVVPPEACTTNADCDDGLFCSGVESCVNGFCELGAPVTCGGDDGVACTDEVCDESSDSCASVPNDANCDDGSFCNGNEVCDPVSGCLPSVSPVICAQSEPACTVEQCVEFLHGCASFPDPSLCDDGIFCNGVDFCDAVLGCQVIPPCNDFTDCTTDTCDEVSGCQNVPNDAFCSDGLFCTGVESCYPGYGCVPGADPCPDPEDTCDEASQSCSDCSSETDPPEFTFVPADITTTICGSLNIGSATAEDFCNVTVTNNAPAVFPPGTTIVTWTATDEAGNVTTATQRVTVILTDNPACCPPGTNVIQGTSNNNTLNGTNGSDCILAKGAQDTVNGNGGVDYISGGDGDDILNGGEGNDVIFGGTGQDQLNGGNGADNLNGGDGDDTVNAGAGNDTLSGGQGQDKLNGQDNNDTLFGDSGDDTLDGGNGNDDLVGGTNNDKCTGGAGTNTFAQCEFGAANSCTSGTKNGTETDIDCGGACNRCAGGAGCVSGVDCVTGLFCVELVCTSAP
jgi:hypothetical protein